MRLGLLGALRCPFCGGRLEVDRSACVVQQGDEIHEAILACQCCTFPVVAGIPVMHLDDPARSAAEAVRVGQPDRARQLMCASESARRFEEVVSSPHSTYREAVQVLVPELEAAYFLHRFSDPSFLVTQALTRTIARVVLQGGGRAIDVCGGSGHLTRALIDLSDSAPVLADLYFPKLWLARRFTAPGCEAVCCDANVPLPFARGSFRFAVCSDALMFIWLKRQLAAELLRLIADDRDRGAVVVGHAHNQLVWSPSHGQPLTPEGYHELFETVPARVLAESRLLEEILGGGALDLAHEDSPERLVKEEAVAIIATARSDVFIGHALERLEQLPGEIRLNPLYAAEREGERVRLRLTFPSEHYEDEFSACRTYLPDSLVIHPDTLKPAAGAKVSSEVAELARRRVLLSLPKHYY